MRPERPRPKEAEVEIVDNERLPERASASHHESSLLRVLRENPATIPAKHRDQRRFLRFLQRAVSNKELLNQVYRFRDAILLSLMRESNDSVSGVTIALTSPRGGEGSSLIHLLLGLALGEHTQRRVALLDGRFDQERFDALSSVLGLSRNGFAVTSSTTEIVGQYNGVCPNVYFLNSPSQENSVHFFSDRRLKTFFSKLRNNFDFTIIDMPPLLTNSANCFVLPYVDRLYLVNEAGKTKNADVRRCMDSAQEAGAEIHGMVINKQTVPLWSRLFWRDFFY